MPGFPCGSGVLRLKRRKRRAPIQTNSGCAALRTLSSWRPAALPLKGLKTGSAHLVSGHAPEPAKSSRHHSQPERERRSPNRRETICSPQHAGSDRGVPTIMNPPTQTASPEPQHELTRRSFIKSGTAAAALTAASWNRVLGANERVGVGVIGFGLVRRIHTRNFKAQPDAQVVAVSETFRPRMDAAVELVGGHVAPCADLRK